MKLKDTIFNFVANVFYYSVAVPVVFAMDKLFFDYKIMGKENIKAYRLGEINKETKYALEYFGVEAPNLLEEVKDEQKVILVDHNGFGQSVKGIEKAKILKVIDHHNISEFRTSEPVFYIGMPVGCTSTILYSLYKLNNIKN